MWQRTLLPLLLLATPTLSLVNGSCPVELPVGCRCDFNEFVFDGLSEKRLMAVICVGVTGIFFPSSASSRYLVPGIEALVLNASDLDSLPEGRLLFDDLPGYDGHSSGIRLLSLVNNINTGQKIDLHTLVRAFPRLEVMHLFNNSLVAERMNLRGVRLPHDLREIDLRSNQLRYLPADTVRALYSLTDLRVDLRDNSFSCDCNLAAMHDWLLDNGGAVVDEANLTCRDGFPETLAGRYLFDVQPDELLCPDLGPGGEKAATEEAHLALRGFYLMMGLLGAVAVAVALFALYLNFPFLVEFTVAWREPKLLSQHTLQSRYISVPAETVA